LFFSPLSAELSYEIGVDSRDDKDDDDDDDDDDDEESELESDDREANEKFEQESDITEVGESDLLGRTDNGEKKVPGKENERVFFCSEINNCGTVEISGSSELEDEISKENENINDEIGERR
jgi:hypothetical protein